jgi:hypothetical protein
MNTLYIVHSPTLATKENTQPLPNQSYSLFVQHLMTLMPELVHLWIADEDKAPFTLSQCQWLIHVNTKSAQSMPDYTYIA